MTLQFYRYKTPKDVIQQFKEFILNDPSGQYDNDGLSQITKTNWGKGEGQPFKDLFLQIYWDGYCEWAKKTLPGSPNLTLDNVWYQVYHQSDNHDWHVHDRVHIANIIYLQLEDSSLLTQFKINDEIYIPQVEEGDTLTFDPSYLHRSPSNTTNTVKIIISFNVNCS